MLVLILRRAVLACLTLAITGLITFAAVEALPGDACVAFLGRDLEADALAQCRTDLGLDKPAVTRLAGWAGGVLTGDLGRSLHARRPVAGLLLPRLRNSILLGGLAALIGIPLAVGLGIFAATRRDRASDVAVSGLSIMAMTLPEFVSATIMVFLFAIWLPWLPAVTIAATDASAADLLPFTVLPVAVLVLVMVAHILRLTRTCVIEQLDSEHCEFARLRGVPSRRLLLHHVLPGALPPIVNLCALTLAWLLCGVVIVERVFNYPGLGTLIIQAIYDRDLPLVQATTLVFAAIYVGINLAGDCLSILLNPRLRTGSA